MPIMPHKPVSAADLYEAHKHSLAFGIDEVDILIGDIPASSLVCVSADNSQDVTRFSTSIVAAHLQTTSKDIAVLDCANTFDVRALKRRLDGADDLNALLGRVKIVRAFDLIEARDGMDKIMSVLEHQLLIINGVSQIVRRANSSQGQATLDAMLRSAQSPNSTVVITDGFVDGEDEECAFETVQRPFFSAANAPTLDLHLHVHNVSQQSLVEIARDRFHGNTGACVQLPNL